jgi:hypothetical protein
MPFYDVTPVNAPAGYVPWFASTADMAERRKHYLEQHYRSRFSVELIFDADDKPRVVFSYPPSYLFNFTVTPTNV